MCVKNVNMDAAWRDLRSAQRHQESLKPIREDMYLEIQTNRDALSPWQKKVVEKDQQRILPSLLGTGSLIGGISLLQSKVLGLGLFRGRFRWAGIVPGIPLFLAPYTACRMMDDYRFILDLMREEEDGEGLSALAKRWRRMCRDQGAETLLDELTENVS